MELSRSVVQKVADLARLKVAYHELDAFVSDLSAIVGYVEILNELDTTGIAPMVHAVELANVLRADIVTPSLERDLALSNAPRTDGTYFLVPAIIDSE